MLNWWKSLGTVWKIALVAFVLIAAIFIWDRITGGFSDVKGWLNDRAYTQRMEKDTEYEKTIADLKAKNVELDKKLVESETKGTILEQNDKALTERTKQELAKLDQALAAQDAEEARTAEQTDSYTRCVRVKQKMIDIGSVTAKEINCENSKQ